MRRASGAGEIWPKTLRFGVLGPISLRFVRVLAFWVSLGGVRFGVLAFWLRPPKTHAPRRVDRPARCGGSQSHKLFHLLKQHLGERSTATLFQHLGGLGRHLLTPDADPSQNCIVLGWRKFQEKARKITKIAWNRSSSPENRPDAPLLLIFY